VQVTVKLSGPALLAPAPATAAPTAAERQLLRDRALACAALDRLTAAARHP
jgi:hypothetical protein